jgi:sterol 3beta-glucosyltransferase
MATMRIIQAEEGDSEAAPQVTFEQNISLKELFSTVEDAALRFGIDDNVVDDYTCAYFQKILLQGRMYITNKHICFYSPFNSNTIFGRDPT